MAQRRVSEVYADIFSADPLLLLPESQAAYGDELLHNLLIHRPRGTSNPHLVDVSSDTSLQRLKRKPAPQIDPIDPALIRRYRLSMRNREPLAEADFDELKNKTMVVRGELTEKRGQAERFIYKNHSQATASLTTNAKRAAFSSRLKIAAVGFRVLIGRSDAPAADEDLCSLPLFQDHQLPHTHDSLVDPSNVGRTVRASPDQAWDTAMIGHMRKVVERNPDVIVFPEFALPPAIAGQDRMADALKAELRGARSNPFVFAGSRHEDRYNRGLIFKKDSQNISESVWHYKRAPARSLFENIIGDIHTTVPNYKTDISFFKGGEFTIGVAICYDSFDPTTFLNLILEAAYATRESLPKILIVPSYNPSSDFVALLRDLSFLARCCVVYVNGLHGDAEMFICGIAISDLDDKLQAVIDTLDRRIAILQAAIDEERKTFSDNVTAIPGYQRTPKERAILDRMKQESAAAAELLRTLRALAASDEMEHLITIEDCPNCTGDTHNLRDRDCFRDIVYYNLNKELISSLIEFRWGYFGNEEFLPKPFRRDALNTP